MLEVRKYLFTVGPHLYARITQELHPEDGDSMVLRNGGTLP